MPYSRAAEISPDMQKHISNIIPLMTAEAIGSYAELIRNARVIALDYSDALIDTFSAVRESVRKISSALVIVRIACSNGH